MGGQVQQPVADPRAQESRAHPGPPLRHRRLEDERPGPLWVARGEVHGRGAAARKSEEGRPADAERVEERGEQIGLLLEARAAGERRPQVPGSRPGEEAEFGAREAREQGRDLVVAPRRAVHADHHGQRRSLSSTLDGPAMRDDDFTLWLQRCPPPDDAPIACPGDHGCLQSVADGHEP